MPTIKFFITPVYPYGNDHYYHEIIALAEGFAELGYKITGNYNYWLIPEKNEYLIKEEAESNFDIAVYDYRYVKSFEHLLFRKGYPNFDRSKIHILIDRNDWIAPIWLNKNYRIFNFIFSGNIYNNIDYPSNIHPWAIGLTNRITKSIDQFYSTDKPMVESIGYNFRVPHNMRKHVFDGLSKTIKKYPLKQCLSDDTTNASKAIDPADTDSFYWHQSTGRHNPSYFRSLNEKLLFLAFGGYMEYKPVLYQPYSLLDKIRRKPYHYYAQILDKLKKDTSPAYFIFQQDNFRFWETLYACSCPINIDLNSWNFLLPATPVNGEHYLGINKFNFVEFTKKLENYSTEEIKAIGKKGREWVIKHYSPTAQAQRIIDRINRK